MAAIISVRNLNKSFQDNHILKDISFDVYEGEFISIVGKSGCGKTTLLKCIDCLIEFNSGTISVNNIILSKEGSTHTNLKNTKTSNFFSKNYYIYQDKNLQVAANHIRESIGILFQNFNLFPHFNVLDNVAKPLRIVKTLDKADAEHIAIDILKKVDMDKYLKMMPHQLSGGQTQRVAIARALAMNPKVILYDEPTSALDPELTEEIIKIMKDLKSEGMTQIVVTHSLKLAKKLSDRTMFMDAGHIVEFSDTLSMFDTPQNILTRQYINILE